MRENRGKPVLRLISGSCPQPPSKSHQFRSRRVRLAEGVAQLVELAEKLGDALTFAHERFQGADPRNLVAFSRCFEKAERERKRIIALENDPAFFREAADPIRSLHGCLLELSSSRVNGRWFEKAKSRLFASAEGLGSLAKRILGMELSIPNYRRLEIAPRPRGRLSAV